MEKMFQEYNNAQKQLSVERRDLLRIKLDKIAAFTALTVLRSAGSLLQEKVHHQIGLFVSRALHIVFEERYEFRIRFVERRKQTEAELELLLDGVAVDPMTATGGGVVDIIAFALRLACLRLSRPSAEPILILDEPFKFVSRDRLPFVKKMLEELSQEAGIQILMVTHLPLLATGRVIEIQEE